MRQASDSTISFCKTCVGTAVVVFWSPYARKFAAARIHDRRGGPQVSTPQLHGARVNVRWPV